MAVPSGEKSTWEDQARVIIQQGYPAVADLLPDLVAWLQDLNWPGATLIAKFLVSIGRPVLPLVREVLAGADTCWQYWVLRELCGQWDQGLVEEIESELERLIWWEDPEGVGVEAMRLLAKNRLSTATVAQRLKARRADAEYLLEELKGIEALLNSE